MKNIPAEIVIKAVFQSIAFANTSIFERYSIKEWRESVLKPIYDFCPARFHAPSKSWKLDKRKRCSVRAQLGKLGVDLNEKKQLSAFADFISKHIPTPIYRRPYTKPIINVHLQNNITAQDVFSALNDSNRYYVYAHSFGENMYIGRTNDLVTRWFDHFDAAFNPFHPDHQYNFKSLIRRNYRAFKHHMLFVTSDVNKAIEYEAQAIEFYSPNLNTKNEIATNNMSFNFFDISLNSPIIPMSRQGRNWALSGNKFPVMAIAKYDSRRGYIRIYCDGGQQYPEGTLITCSKSQRVNLTHGQRVIINARWQATKRCLNGLSEDIIPL